MRPFVVRLEPTPFDPASASSATGKDDQASLKHTWNAWNAKARGLIVQGSRIENLYWRRWHMDQRQGAVYHASPPLPQANFPNDLSASVEAVERRRATEDLEAFLRNTLQAAQPTTQAQVAHNPPTYDAFLPPASSAPQQPPAPPSIPPPAQNTFQPPVIHAPQPQRAPYNLSPEWGYTNLPASSLPPPSSSANLSRIIATPSWTALISDPAAAAAVAQLQHQQHQHSAHQQHMQQQMHYPGALGFPPPFGYPPLQPHLAPPMDPFAAAFPYGLPTQQQPPHSMSMMPPPIPSPSFTLPPTATLFSDLGTALSSAPSAAAPPAFFSSYGMYQPVVAPYPRFLTPSPEPSVLGELELELGPSTGEFDAAAAAAVAAAGGVAGTATNGQSSGDPDGMDSVWKDFENGHEIGANGVGGAAGAAGGGGSGSKTDPFEGMSLAQMRSRANSLEAIDREAARFQAYGVNEAGGGTLAEQAAREVEMAALAASGHVPPAKGAGAVKGKRKAENGGGGGKKAKAAAAAAATSTSSTPAGSPPLAAGAVNAASALLPPGSEPLDADGKPLGKKNRNPHSTQLPGNGQRRLPKEEAGEGHDGPICSHCASITTPLWRRGPEDELLCNACGLYLKLHGKPRPKTFGKNNGSKRSSNGAAAQAAASGVPPSCNNCGATSTPMWRKDPEGKLCCNACSLYYKLHKVARPASLAQKRKAAAAAKANLAAAAAATTDANAEASTSAQKLPGSSGTTTPTTATGDTTMSAPPLSQLQSHALPHYPQTFQLPPVLPPPQPHPSLLGSDGQPQSHLQLPPGWPLGGMPGYPPYPPPPPQQQQQQQQNGAAPPPQAPPPMPHPHLQHHYQQQHLFQQQQQQLLQQQQQHLQQQHAQNLQQQQQQQQQKHQQKFTLPPAIPAPLPPSPFAQTAWGALAYGIVSAAAAEEAGGVQGSQTPQPQPPPQQQQQQQQQQNPPTFPGAPPPA